MIGVFKKTTLLQHWLWQWQQSSGVLVVLVVNLLWLPSTKLNCHLIVIIYWAFSKVFVLKKNIILLLNPVFLVPEWIHRETSSVRALWENLEQCLSASTTTNFRGAKICSDIQTNKKSARNMNSSRIIFLFI